MSSLLFMTWICNHHERHDDNNDGNVWMLVKNMAKKERRDWNEWMGWKIRVSHPPVVVPDSLITIILVVFERENLSPCLSVQVREGRIIRERRVKEICIVCLTKLSSWACNHHHYNIVSSALSLISLSLSPHVSFRQIKGIVVVIAALSPSINNTQTFLLRLRKKDSCKRREKKKDISHSAWYFAIEGSRKEENKDKTRNDPKSCCHDLTRPGSEPYLEHWIMLHLLSLSVCQSLRFDVGNSLLTLSSGQANNGFGCQAITWSGV